MKKAAELVPQDLSSGVVDRASNLMEGISNSEALENMDVRTGGMGLGSGDRMRRMLMSPFADSDQSDGQQVIVADTGSDMDFWSMVTAQQQASGGLEGIVDAVEANVDGEEVQSMEFKSHGFENNQHVAAGAGGHVGQNLSAEQTEQFGRLGSLLSEDGEIIMAGCNVAQNHVAHHENGGSTLDAIAAASDRSVTAGVAIQLPLDGVEGSSITVHPDGTYDYDTSSAKQVYDVTANGLGEMASTMAGNASWWDAAGDVANTAWDMGGDFVDITSDVVHGTQNADGWTPPGAETP